jgi:hypothetical protein
LLDWKRHLTEVLWFAPIDPLFPKTVIGQDGNNDFVAIGVSREHWASAQPVRNIVKQAFEAAGLPYFHPHTFRHMLVQQAYTNADVAEVLGFDDLTRHGRVLGNITSRIDFACYRQGVPPLGLCAMTPFANAWSQEGRAWAFPVATMQAAAQTFDWRPDALENIRREARALPGQAAIPWRKENDEKESFVRQWAEGLRPNVVAPVEPGAPASEAGQLDALERKLLDHKPAVRERVSKTIERGPIGAMLKKANGYRCQLCDALGKDSLGFLKPNGERYVEAHHATPVSAMEVGSLSATNIMILCANHHRQMHYGGVIIERTATEFVLTMDGHRKISIKRFSLGLT